MKKPLVIGAAVVVLAALVAISIATGGEGKRVKVFAEKAVRRGITQTVRASGQIQPRIKVNISAHVIGKIEKLYVEEGDTIESGQPFLELERPAFLAERDNARAQLAKSESEERQASISLADQEVRLARANRLSQEGIASAEALEAAELAFASAKLRVEQAHEGRVQARALLDKAEDDLRKTTIYAPLTGRVIALNAEQGEVVVSGTMNNPASVIGTIADLSEILAEIDVDETEIVHLKAGQAATVRVDALPDKSYRARVVEIGSSGYSKPAQPDVTFFRVKLLLDSPEETLRPGMSARADIEVATHADAIAVPIQSVVEREPEVSGAPAAAGAEGGAPAHAKPEQVVYTVEGKKAKSQRVTTGLSDATHVEIAGGLAEGALVVTGPHRTLKRLEDGDSVQVTRPDLEKKKDSQDEEEKD
jgi:HlyD family secretion protein